MNDNKLMNSIIFKTDSYKLGHDKMYDPDTNKVYSYFEARGGATFPKTVFFGLQPILLDNLVNAYAPTNEEMDEIKKLIDGHIAPGAFNEKWNTMPTGANDDGELVYKLPLSIKAVPEGTPVEVGNVMMTVENTDENGDYRFLTNYVESLLTHVWYPSTVATKSYYIKQMIQRFLGETSDNPDDFINFMLHDFGYRGATSDEAAMVGGMAHLVNFLGTDTVPALSAAKYYYGTNEPVGYSVYATEHSIMTQLGQEGEMDVVERLLRNETYKNGILAMVIDSYDWVNFLYQMGTPRFKELILDRKGSVVFRPDSGHPRNVSMKAWDILSKGFGYTTNQKGYKVLNPKVRLLWGDGIDIDGISDILEGLKDMKVSSQDILFGMGGALLQKVNRDTQRFAFKSSYQERNGKGFDIFKDPIDGSKKSKPGKLALVKTADGFKTVKLNTEWYDKDSLVEVFRDGELLADYTFDDVRRNSKLN